MEKQQEKIVFFIGAKKYETEKSHLTPRQILTDFAKVSPETNTLALKKLFRTFSINKRSPSCSFMRVLARARAGGTARSWLA